MVPDLERARQEAMSLPPDERAALAGELIHSLDPEDVDEGVEAAWELEIARRIAELDAGTAKTVPWEEVRRQLMAIIDAKRSR